MCFCILHLNPHNTLQLSQNRQNRCTLIHVAGVLVEAEVWNVCLFRLIWPPIGWQMAVTKKKIERPELAHLPHSPQLKSPTAYIILQRYCPFWENLRFSRSFRNGKQILRHIYYTALYCALSHVCLNWPQSFRKVQIRVPHKILNFTT